MPLYRVPDELKKPITIRQVCYACGKRCLIRHKAVADGQVETVCLRCEKRTTK